MAGEFFVEKGALSGVILVLEEGDKWTIGRDPKQCNLLLEDSDIERKHLLCCKNEEGYTLQDISEGKKTLLNGELLTGEQKLADADEIIIGKVVLRFFEESIGPSVAKSIMERPESAEIMTILETLERNSRNADDSLPLEPEDFSDEKPEEEEGAFDEPLEEESVAEEPVVDESKKDPTEKSFSEESPDQEFAQGSDDLPEQEDDSYEEERELTQKELPDEVLSQEALSEEVALEEVIDEEESVEEELAEETVIEEEEPLADEVIEEDMHEPLPFEQVEEFHLDLTQTVRFILKVIAGPNTGAEFAIDTGKQYLIGTDTNTCDIVFYDLSVSREHAKLSIDTSGKAIIEDLNSRNGVLIDQRKIKKEEELLSSSIVTVGTTSFFLIDKEAPQETIITPIFEPSMEEEEEVEQEEEEEEEEELVVTKEEIKSSNVSGALVLCVIIICFVALLGFGIFTLSDAKEIVVPEKNFGLEIAEALKTFPTVEFSYNKGTQKLFLVGHVVSSIRLNEMHYKLQGLPFLKGIDDNVVDDEAVWQEMNLLLAKHADFKGVSMHSPLPGVFVLNGYLKTERQATALSDYMNLHFNYLSSLQNRVVVEEQVNEEVASRLLQKGFGSVESMFLNGELVFTGYIGSTQTYDFDYNLKDFAKIPGVRNLLNYVVVVSPEQQVVDLSMRYPGHFKVTGYSKHGDVNINVVINGRILTRGDSLDGMTITSIQPHTVFLEKEGLKYKIDYNK